MSMSLATFLATVDAPVTGLTPAPTRTPPATSTPMATATPQPSSTPWPSSTPRPSSTPVGVAVATRAATVAATRTQPEAATNGPTSATILQPGDNHSSDTSTVFKWVANAPLAPGQEFEVVFWKANGQTEAQGRGIIRSSTASETWQPVASLAPDGYKWALLLVQAEPSYSRLRRLAGPFNFNVPGQWDPYREPDSGSDSVSEKRREQP